MRNISLRCTLDKVLLVQPTLIMGPIRGARITFRRPRVNFLIRCSHLVSCKCLGSQRARIIHLCKTYKLIYLDARSSKF